MILNMKIYLSLSLILVITGCFAIAEDQEQAKASASTTWDSPLLYLAGGISLIGVLELSSMVTNT